MPKRNKPWVPRIITAYQNLERCKEFLAACRKPQAASDKPQAASRKRQALDKVKQIQDNRGYKQKEKYGKHNKTNTTNE